MIKQLMVGLDGSKNTRTVVQYGVDLAKIHKARLIGLCVADTTDIENAYHTPRPLGAGSADAELYKKSLEKAQARADSALSIFQEVCEEQKVEHQGIKREGNPARQILKTATLNDMVIMSQKTRFSYGLADDQHCDASKDVLDESVRPLVLVPDEHRKIKKVMLAMDLHRLSDRMFYNYVHLNPYPGAKVHLIHGVQADEKDKEFPEDIIQYFKVHGIEVKASILHGDHLGQAIVNYANTEEMDMVVMGIHTVSKVWQVLIGSTGRYVIEHLDLPIYTQT